MQARRKRNNRRGRKALSAFTASFRVALNSAPNPQGVFAMLLNELRARKQDVSALGRRYGARRIRVFGSVARGEETASSDIDFLVDFPAGYDLFGQRLPLTEHLSELFRRTVEVIPEHELNRHIRDQVLREAVEL
jgi:predicted nucleotidyltransferase